MGEKIRCPAADELFRVSLTLQPPEKGPAAGLLAPPARLELTTLRLGVAPISHREVTPDAKKCLEILGFSAFPIPSDTTL